MDCPQCGVTVPECERHCPGCQADIGFPNVRAAAAPAEEAALDARVHDAEVSTAARGCRPILDSFGIAVLQSKVVLCRSLGILYRLVSSDTELYSTYYRAREAGTRLPEDNEWDRYRGAVDGTLFPNYHKDIVFAALTLDNHGVQRFGAYAVFLRDAMIQHRASVFEENSRCFCVRHKVTAGLPIPPGYRATWKERNRLAIAKLHSKLDGTTAENDFPGVLLSQGKVADDDNFIEVHIFGPIQRRAIERVVGPKPKKRQDVALWKALDGCLKEVGAVLEVQ